MKKLIKQIEQSLIVTQVTDDYVYQSALETFDNCPSDFVKPLIENNNWIECASMEEVEEAKKALIPESISRMHFKIQLLLRDIEIENIISTINDIPNSMFPEVAKKIAIIKFNEAVTFDRYNADLNLVATLMGISQTDLDEIFINGNL